MSGNGVSGLNSAVHHEYNHLHNMQGGAHTWRPRSVAGSELLVSGTGFAPEVGRQALACRRQAGGSACHLADAACGCGPGTLHDTSLLHQPVLTKGLKVKCGVSSIKWEHK